MIHSVEITNYRGEKLMLELDNPLESGFVVREITGIGPAKADVNTSGVATMDGDIYNSARLQGRNIVLTLAFAGDAEVSRHKSYQYFPVKKPILLTFKTDARQVRTAGYVESNIPNVFSPETSAQISVICPDPFFYDANPDYQAAAFYGVEPAFEFPYENNSTVAKLTEFGVVQRVVEQNIYYSGDVPTGLVIRIRTLGPVGDISVHNTVLHTKLTVYQDRLTSMLGTGSQNGDEITIVTSPKQKRAQLLRDGSYYNIINALGWDFDWLTLEPGDNLMAFTATSGVDNVQLTILHDNIYEGV